MRANPTPARRSRSVVLLAALAAGCSQVEDPGAANFSTVDVAGTITAAGKPVAEGIIIFQPIVDGGSTQQATGTIHDGRFTLNSGGDRAGAMPGTYRVNVETTDGQTIRSVEPVEAVVPDNGGDVTIAFQKAIVPPGKSAARSR